MKKVTELRGTVATVFTPFKDKSNNVDFELLRKHLEFVCASNAKAIFPLASCGEFPFLCAEEKKEYLRLTAEVNAGRKGLIAGCCGFNYTETMLLMGWAKEFSYDAAIVCPPYYISHTPDELLRYYTAVAANPYGMRVILYNIPVFTSEITTDLLRKLMENEMIIGCKDTSGNGRRIRTMAQFREDLGREETFNIYCGSDDMSLASRVGGANGSCTALGYIVPELVSAMHEAYDRGDLETAIRYQRPIAELCRVAETVAFPAGYKLIARKRGMDMGFEHNFVNPDDFADAEARIDRELAAAERDLGLRIVIM